MQILVDIATQKWYYNKCKEVHDMSKKKKKKAKKIAKKKTLSVIVFATAILNLVYVIIELLEKVLK